MTTSSAKGSLHLPVHCPMYWQTSCWITLVSANFSVKLHATDRFLLEPSQALISVIIKIQTLHRVFRWLEYLTLKIFINVFSVDIVLKYINILVNIFINAFLHTVKITTSRHPKS